MNHFQKSLFFVLCLFITKQAASQPLAKWSIGLESGVNVYQGDVSREGFGTLRAATYSWGGNVLYHLDESWSVGLYGHSGELMASDHFYPNDAYRLARNFEFTTKYSDAALMARFSPFSSLRLQPQLGIGLGMVFFKPSAFLLDNTHLELADFIKLDIEEEFKDRVLFVPLSFGLSFQASRFLSFQAGLQYNFTQTDFLDGISFSANPNTSDRYGQLYIGARIHLGKPSDLDEDGIADFEDNCPLKPGPLATGGCPDADKDGIRDSEDRCPFAAGVKALQGCPDTDGDGTADPFDRCPTVAGTPEALGCPPQDTDMDGVLDHLDDCPLEKGPPDRAGCPAIDSDQDGLLDEDDYCPNHFGILLFHGCPDTDGDGIEDTKDACPNTFGLFDEDGCPKTQGTQELAELLSAQILYFRINSADLSNYKLLNKLTVFLAAHPDYRLSISGHADIESREQAPGYMSLLRAERVKRYLLGSGVPEHQLTVRGFSSRELLSDNDLAPQYFKNRRVVFKLERRE